MPLRSLVMLSQKHSFLLSYTEVELTRGLQFYPRCSLIWVKGVEMPTYLFWLQSLSLSENKTTISHTILKKSLLLKVSWKWRTSVVVMCFGLITMETYGRQNRVWAKPMSGPQSALQVHWEVLTFFSCSVKEIRTCFSCHTSRFGISVHIPTSTRLLWFFMIILRMCLKWGSSTARGRCWDPNLLGRCSQLSTHHPLPSCLLHCQCLLQTHKSCIPTRP